jgi:hypothetical protein
MAILLQSSVMMEVLDMRGAIIGAPGTFAQVTITSGSSPYAVTPSDYYVDVDALLGDVVVNLPTAFGIGGKAYNVKKVDPSAHRVTVNATGSETIDDLPSQIIAMQYTSMEVHSDSIRWLIS